MAGIPFLFYDTSTNLYHDKAIVRDYEKALEYLDALPDTFKLVPYFHAIIRNRYSTIYCIHAHEVIEKDGVDKVRDYDMISPRFENCGLYEKIKDFYEYGGTLYHIIFNIMEIFANKFTICKKRGNEFVRLDQPTYIDFKYLNHNDGKYYVKEAIYTIKRIEIIR